MGKTQRSGGLKTKSMFDWFNSDGDIANENIRWEKYPIKIYFIWTIISILLIVIIYNCNLSIPHFSMMIYFGITFVIHIACMKYIGISLSKPFPSRKEIVRLWLKRLEADDDLFVKNNEQILIKQIKRKLLYLRLFELVIFITTFFLMFWPIFGTAFR
jgi:hypothetical protein